MVNLSNRATVTQDGHPVPLTSVSGAVSCHGFSEPPGRRSYYFPILQMMRRRLREAGPSLQVTVRQGHVKTEYSKPQVPLCSEPPLGKKASRHVDVELSKPKETSRLTTRLRTPGTGGGVGWWHSPKSNPRNLWRKLEQSKAQLARAPSWGLKEVAGASCRTELRFLGRSKFPAP